MNHLFVELFSSYTRVLDLYGEKVQQKIQLTPLAFKELKDFIQQWDEWSKSEPMLPLSRNKIEIVPMLPNLEIERPFILMDGYKFDIIII